MQPQEPDTPASPGAPGQGQVGPEPARSAQVVARRQVTWALIAASLAVIASWYACEQLRGRFQHALYPNDLGRTPSDEKLAQIAAWNVEHAAATYAVFGAILGAALGLAGGLSRRSAGHAAVASLAGLILGGAAGAGVCLAGLPLHDRHTEIHGDSLIVPLLMHGAIWSAIGAAAGLALGIGSGGVGRSFRALLGGLLGALIATMLYDVLGALAFPLDKTNQPLSATSTTRLLAQGLLAVFVAVAAASCARMTAPAHEQAAPPG